MRKLSKLALGALFAGALAAPALAEDGVTDTEIMIGSHTALSGPVSAWGVGATEGTRMRFDEANEKGHSRPQDQADRGGPRLPGARVRCRRPTS